MTSVVKPTISDVVSNGNEEALMGSPAKSMASNHNPPSPTDSDPTTTASTTVDSEESSETSSESDEHEDTTTSSSQHPAPGRVAIPSSSSLKQEQEEEEEATASTSAPSISDHSSNSALSLHEFNPSSSLHTAAMGGGGHYHLQQQQPPPPPPPPPSLPTMLSPYTTTKEPKANEHMTLSNFVYMTLGQAQQSSPSYPHLIPTNPPPRYDPSLLNLSPPSNSRLQQTGMSINTNHHASGFPPAASYHHHHPHHPHHHHLLHRHPDEATSSGNGSGLSSSSPSSSSSGLLTTLNPSLQQQPQPPQLNIKGGFSGSGGSSGLEHHEMAPQSIDGGGGGGGGGGRRRKRTHENLACDQHASSVDGSEPDYPSGLIGGGGGGGGESGDVTVAMGSGSGLERTGSTSASSQQLKWQAHMIDTWNEVSDDALRNISKGIQFQVETDKGFNFSTVDDSFVCQKKNHFQVTVQIEFPAVPKYLKVKDSCISMQPIEKLTLHLNGIKFEQAISFIHLDQSLADRKKHRFEPNDVDMPTKSGEIMRCTICRLHFNETTQNNMRKRGKPNPDQKYFCLVVALHAVTKSGSYPIVAHVSERIIVRASNPGTFENDCDHFWLRASNEVIYRHGRVGINTDKPDEALTVHGSIQVTGALLQTSDARAKRNIQRLTGRDHLKVLSQLQLHEYQLDEGASQSDRPHKQVGLLAQQVKAVLPNAVHETSTSLALADGSSVEGLLMVDKDQVLMETIGALQQLMIITERLQQRVESYEQSREEDLTKHGPRPHQQQQQQHCSTCCQCGAATGRESLEVPQTSDCVPGRRKTHNQRVARCDSGGRKTHDQAEVARCDPGGRKTHDQTYARPSVFAAIAAAVVAVVLVAVVLLLSFGSFTQKPSSPSTVHHTNPLLARRDPGFGPALQRDNTTFGEEEEEEEREEGEGILFLGQSTFEGGGVLCWCDDKPQLLSGVTEFKGHWRGQTKARTIR